MLIDSLDQSLTLRIQLLSILGVCCLVGLIVYFIRKQYLKAGYSLIWFFTSLILLILTVFSNLLFAFSKAVGIFYTPAALFLILIVGLLLISIHYSVTLSKHEKRIKELAQELALLKSKKTKK